MKRSQKLHRFKPVLLDYFDFNYKLTISDIILKIYIIFELNNSFAKLIFYAERSPKSRS